MNSMDPRDIRTWAANQQAASSREMVELRNRPLPPSQAFAFALALLSFDEKQNGSPFNRYDPVSEREDEAMWDAWARLRARWRNGR